MGIVVAVHPEDKRYAHLIGTKIWRPYPKKRFRLLETRMWIVSLNRCLVHHDKNDYEIGQRHGLEIIEVIDAAGILMAEAGELFAD